MNISSIHTSNLKPEYHFNKVLILIIFTLILTSAFVFSGSISACTCGDGNTDLGEQCDDGNTTNGDGCSSVCTIETPSPFCGDGNTDPGEQCDDGNTINGDGCSSVCIIESCEYGCFTPDSLGDTQSETVINGSEKTLQETLTDLGYVVDVNNDQTNIQVWHTTDSAELEITYLGGFADNRHVFGYYLNNDPLTFVGMFEHNDHPLYSLPIANQGDKFTITINSGNVVGFAIDDYSVSSQKHFTENSLNGSSLDRVLVFDFCDEFVLTFNDFYNDLDYQDTIVGIKVTTCGTCSFCGDGNTDSGEQCDDGNTVNGDGCSAICTIEPFIIKAYKIVCDSEQYLPNWGLIGTQTEEPVFINENTATDYVAAHSANCHIEDNWNFQWGYYDNAVNLNTVGGDFVGLIPAGINDNQWKNFDSPTIGGNPAEANIYNLKSFSSLWVRESLQTGYVPFAGTPSGNLQEDVSAEMYCHDDILNFDNYDYVSNPVLGGTSYCVAFNALDFFCGDNNLDPGEQCDDGNIVDGDGCSSVCTIETPSPFCGDGNTDLGEDCDDGNIVDGDGC
ncbi:MAG: DUF4215 domain-containing protein, partial [Patescibacteria group bacterium]